MPIRHGWILACLFLVPGLVPGCTTSAQTSEAPTGSPAPEASADAGDEDKPKPTVEVREEKPEDGARAPGPALPTGAVCSTHADCGEGGVCEGVGCGEGEGRCAVDPGARMCTRDLASYCGCDGKLFQASGSCPGDRYAYRGPCEPARSDGEPCTDGRQCASGQCVGEGLEGCTPASSGGVCAQTDCTADLATYCSCNANEFQTSGSCPNRQFAYRGPCEAAQ